MYKKLTIIVLVMVLINILAVGIFYKEPHLITMTSIRDEIISVEEFKDGEIKTTDEGDKTKYSVSFGYLIESEYDITEIHCKYDVYIDGEYKYNNYYYLYELPKNEKWYLPDLFSSFEEFSEVEIKITEFKGIYYTNRW